MVGITKNRWLNKCRHLLQIPTYHLSRHEFPSIGNYVKMQIVTLYQAIAIKYLKTYMEDVKDVAIK
jgi:hypothetical protein